MAEIIEMPKLSDTMTTGTLVNWLVKEGDEVSGGTMIAEVETDKATMEVENFEDGVILKLYAKEGDSVAIGEPICAVGEKGEKAPDVAKKKEEAKKATEDGGETDADAREAEDDEESADSGKTVEDEQDGEDAAAEPAAAAEKDQADKQSEKKEAAKPPDAEDGGGEASARPSADEQSDRVRSSPLARRLAEEKGIDITLVKGSGPGGRIVRADVEKAAKEGTAPKSAAPAKKEAAPSAPSASLPVETLEAKELPVTNMRAAIARALVSSKTEAPHFYLQTEVDGAPLAVLRKSLNDGLAGLPAEQGGGKFTVNDLILKASAEAVRRVPAINRSWKGDKIVQHGAVHLAFGVAVDDGLVTPVIRDAHAKGLRLISAEAKELIGKARNRKLKPDEMQGSTLTVTNLGMFGITDFYGIINPPNAAILSVGATVKTPVVDGDGRITVGHRMKVGLSGDHRVIDGALGAQYLAALREILENPALMLV